MEPSRQTLTLFITHVDKEGPFLKVWGQAERNNSIYVEQFLLGASQQFEQGIGKIPFETLQVGTLVCAKYKDNKYYRARIVSVDYLNECFVEVNFVDYGHKDIVPSSNIRSLQNFPTSFISIPPLATGFIFAEAHCPGGGEWKDQIFEIISKELRYREVQCHLLTQATQFYLIKLYIDNTDIGALFINRGLMQPIPLHAQQAVLLSMSMQRKPTAPPIAPAAAPVEINTYKACTLEPLQQYAVYVSFVNEGPTHFSVQLQQSEHMLAKLMKDINEISLRMLEDVPLPGTICLARCQEDGNICRAVVTNEVDNQFKVFYVDFGNYETLPLESLYQIPFKYVLPKVMAIRLALNGVEKSTVTMEMLLAFKKFVDNRLLHMKVLPSAKKTAIPKCELWDPEAKTSALEVINRAAQHAYPDPLLLNRGFTQPVKVTYVFSCSRFYVQLLSKEQELSKLMDELQISCPSNDPVYDIKIGLPCCVLFEADGLWYRCEVADVVDKDSVKVRYIDYGNEEVVAVSHLKMIEGELLTVLRPQAIECCLSGYQNMAIDETRDALLEELILEQSFTMKVTEMLGKKALVELIDSNNYNVASLLLDKIAASKSQVSPMLVQAGNTLEHRKSSDSSDNYRPQRKPARDFGRNDISENRNSDKTIEKPWRNDNRDTRQHDTGSNDGSTDGGSWRQNNKGFNRNENNNRDRDRGDRDPRDRPSVNERFSRNKNDRGNDNRNNNWSNKENGVQNSSSWDDPGKEVSQPSDSSWGDSTPSAPARGGFEGRRTRDDGFGGRKKFDDRGDRSTTNDRGGWGNKDNQSSERNDRGGWGNKESSYSDRGDKGGWGNKESSRSDRGDKGGWGNKESSHSDRGDKGGWSNKENSYSGRGDKGGWGNKESSYSDRGDKGGWGNKESSYSDRGDKGGWGNKESSYSDRGDKGGWGSRDGFKKDGFKKDGFKKDFRKDGSEMSSSGSEKSFKKGPRTSSRNDFSGGKRFQNRVESSFANDSWSVSDVSTPIDAAPATATFSQLDVVGSESSVTVSWFHSPVHFYCQLQSGGPEFKTLMEEIQLFYKNRKAETCVVGAPVIGLFPEDNVLYRAQILEASGGEYKVFYVDFGNVSTISKVWPIEKKFMEIPAQAICCSLRGVGPNGDSWQDCSAFAKFFGKEFYMARFLEKDEHTTYIELWDNQEEVAQLIIQAGLAVPVAAQVAGGVEIPLLFNQQFQIVLKSVNNLSDIIVFTENELALTCKAHNLDTASETYEDVLKGYLEKTLIVYVDNILENDVLEVTFYDNDGYKLAILTPDEGALDYVHPLCPLLIISSQFYGFVSHANETSVFIQPSAEAEKVAILLDQMFQFYEKSSEEHSIIPQGGEIYAVHSSDDNWYRGRVEDVDEEKVTVFYVDYGNTETVDFGALRVLQGDFNVPYMLCTEVTSKSGSGLTFLEKEVLASIYYGETGWEGTFELTQSAEVGVTEAVESTTISADSDLPTQGETLIEETSKSEDSAAVLDDEKENVCDLGATQEASEIPCIGTPVYVSHIDSPTEFYVQFTESATDLEQLQQKLQDTVEEMPVLENISVGVLCAAPYSVDHLWYRAEVLDADEDITTVRFVDFGNTDVINNMTTQIKTLPSDLLTLAVYATRCSLKLKAIEDEWSQQALELFESLANQENVTSEFIIQDEKTNIVELYSKGENVKDAILAKNLAVPCEIVTQSKTTCFVSHLNSPSEFWVQMENCIDELEWIAEQLSEAENFPELEDMSPGTLCAALFPDDEMWYRARILSNTIAGIELLFIDYGNSSVSSSLRQLPEDLVVTSPLAQKCCLQRPEGIPYWTKEAQDKFAELSAEGQTIFQVKKITTGETATVELLLNGENIVPMILPVTEDGYVKDFESLNKFSIEKNGEILPESYCLEPMPGMEWDDESNKKFLDLYPDGTVFQTEFIHEDCVRLYKDGVDIRPDLGGIKSNLNLSNTRDEKTDNVDISEEDIIDYIAGGDNLHTKHSIENNTQDDSGKGQAASETSETIAQSDPSCDEKEELTLDEVNEKNSSQESGTDSEHHLEQEIKNDEKESVTDQGILEDNEKDHEKVCETDDVSELKSDPSCDTKEEVTADELIEKNSSQESETDSGHHSEQELKDGEKKSVTDQGILQESEPKKGCQIDDVSEVKSDQKISSEVSETGSEHGSVQELRDGGEKSVTDQKILEENEKDHKKVYETDLSEVKSDPSSDKKDKLTLDEAKENISSQVPETDSEQHSEQEPKNGEEKSANQEHKNAQTNVCEFDGVSKTQPSENKLPVKEGRSRSSSVDKSPTKSHDDKIIPGCVSRPQSPLSNDHIPTQEESISRPPSSQESISRPPSSQESISRPPSSQGRRVSHDDKIVPAVLSRPHTPFPDDSETN